MSNFPTWTFTVSSGVRASIAVRALVTNYNLMESSLRQAMGAMPSMEAYRRSLQDDNGNLSSGAYSHYYLGGVTASQHHDKLHGTTHITATDAIPLASANANGLMSSTQYVKVAGISSSANRKPIACGRCIGNYTVGNPSASKYINLGFTPYMVKYMHYNSGIGMWEAYRNLVTVWFHAVTLAAANAHYKQGGASTIRIVTNGFRVYSTLCNQNNTTYYFVAVGIS